MSNDWATPMPLVRRIERAVGLGSFELDACAEDARVKKAPLFIAPSEPEPEFRDGFIGANCLVHPWGERHVWMNPPYGRGQLEVFLGRAVHQWKAGATVVALVPLDPSVRWWRHVMTATAIMVPDRRIKFVGAPTGYTKPVCAPVWLDRQPPAIPYSFEMLKLTPEEAGHAVPA